MSGRRLRLPFISSSGRGSRTCPRRTNTGEPFDNRPIGSPSGSRRAYFGWEKSFRNKAKFPATLSKEDARRLVAGLLQSALLAIHPNRGAEGSVSRQLRIVAEAGHVVGTRGQQRVRIIIVRDAAGFLVENAFPVHQH